MVGFVKESKPLPSWRQIVNMKAKKRHNHKTGSIWRWNSQGVLADNNKGQRVRPVYLECPGRSTKKVTLALTTKVAWARQAKTSGREDFRRKRGWTDPAGPGHHQWGAIGHMCSCSGKQGRIVQALSVKIKTEISFKVKAKANGV